MFAHKIEDRLGWLKMPLLLMLAHTAKVDFLAAALLGATSQV